MSTEVLRVIVFPGGANLPLWVAQEHGLFAQEGTSIAISPTPNSVFLVKSLMQGDQDIALSNFDNIVGYQEGQGEVTLSEAPDFFAFMGFSRGSVRLVVNPQIKSFADLEGKTLGVDAVATGYSLALRKMLRLSGLADGAYTLESIGGTAMRARALMENKIAGTILTTPLELVPESRGFRRLANLADVVGPYQTIVGMARRSWAARHSDALIGFARAAVNAIEWLFDARNRIDVARIYRQHLPEASEAAALAAVDAMLREREGFSRGGSLDPEGMATVLRIRSEFGRPPRQLDDPHRYIDETYLRAATAAR